MLRAVFVMSVQNKGRSGHRGGKCRAKRLSSRRVNDPPCTLQPPLLGCQFGDVCPLKGLTHPSLLDVLASLTLLEKSLFSVAL